MSDTQYLISWFLFPPLLRPILVRLDELLTAFISSNSVTNGTIQTRTFNRGKMLSSQTRLILVSVCLHPSKDTHYSSNILFLQATAKRPKTGSSSCLKVNSDAPTVQRSLARYSQNTNPIRCQRCYLMLWAPIYTNSTERICGLVTYARLERPAFWSLEFINFNNWYRP